MWVNEDVFTGAKIKEADAERDVGEALKQIGLRGYYTRSQLAKGEVPNTPTGLQYAHSYSPLGGWYVLGVPIPFSVGETSGTDHASPYNYDTHVPIIFMGAGIKPGRYNKRAAPNDIAPTLARWLGVGLSPSADVPIDVLIAAAAPK